MHRKTILLLALAASLVAALVIIITDDNLRDRLGSSYYVLSLSMIGCVLLLLAGYVWDRTLLERLRTLRGTARSAATISRPNCKTSSLRRAASRP